MTLNNLGFIYQSGFKKGHSCETALLKIHQDLINVLEPNQYAIMLFLDFSSAFDTVNHKHLLHKLQNEFYIEGYALQWFEDFLTNRKFCTKVDDTLSDWYYMNCGVPQGSVLGPAVFSLYTQKISKIIDLYGYNTHMYADDIQIYSHCDCDEIGSKIQTLNECFDQIVLWCNQNFLKLNHSKSKLIIISRKLNKKSYALLQNTTKFKLETAVKNLGFSIDFNLNFSKQINQVCQRGYYLLRNLWRIASKLTDEQLKIQIIKSCLLCHIDYCNSLYICLPKKQIKKLQRLMNAAIRFIYNVRFTDHNSIISITQLMKRCHFLPVSVRIEFKVCTLVYKCLNCSAPVYLTELIQRKSSLESLRIFNDQFLLQKPKLDTKNYKNRRFSIIAPQLWNGLPLEIRSSASLTIFISKLKTFYFSKCFN